MEISQIGAGALFGATTNQSATAQPRSFTRNTPAGVAPNQAAAARSRPVSGDPLTGVDGSSRTAVPSSEPRRQALSILRQEIRQVLQSSFRIRFAATAPGYAATRAANADDVAGDALNGAAAIAKRSPLDASRTLVDLRERVELKAKEVREVVGADDDDDYDDALSRISGGLDDIEDYAARNVESSATVLSAESRLKQRSTIRIRTQEGDVVRFDLRRVEKMSAEDVSMRNGDMSFSSTEVEISSRSRMRLRVDGDLNEAEFAAIQNVFAQAEDIADEFFGGDLAAAFDMAAGIQFDSEQLARVNMRFREKLESEISYATTSRILSRPAPSPVPATDTAPAIETAPKTELPPPAKPVEIVAPVIEQAPVTQPVAAANDSGAGSPAPTLAGNALEGFFDLLSDFLRTATEGFEAGDGAGSFRFFYSQSFKLEILRSVIDFKAPDEAAGAADTAGKIIEGIAGSRDD